jgi:hypothetical protein
MEGSRFDTWTRRRVGLATGGLAASLLGLADPAAEARRRKKKKKRCRKVTETCGGRNQKCCKDLRCATVGIGTTEICCIDVRQACNGDPGQCCGARTCDFIDGLSGIRCCGVTQSPCSNSNQCCRGYLCNNQGLCEQVS